MRIKARLASVLCARLASLLCAVVYFITPLIAAEDCRPCLLPIHRQHSSPAGAGPALDTASRSLTLRGGSSDVFGAPSTAGRAGDPSGGGWQGAQDYLATTGINITATAGSIAAYRSAVTLCNSSYLDDPFAALFARESCPERFKEILSLPAPKLVRFAVRTKFFDNFIRDCVHRHGIKQVVMIGAGFDARVLRGKDMRWDLVAPPTAHDMMESNILTFYELDLPELMDRKRELLERSGMGPRAAKALGAFTYRTHTYTFIHAHAQAHAGPYTTRTHVYHDVLLDQALSRVPEYELTSCRDYINTNVYMFINVYICTYAYTCMHVIMHSASRSAARAPNRGGCHV